MQERVRCERSSARPRSVKRGLGLQPVKSDEGCIPGCGKKSGQNRDIAQYFLRKPGAHGRVRSCKNEGGMIPAPLRADGMKTIRLFRRGKCFARNGFVKHDYPA